MLGSKGLTELVTGQPGDELERRMREERCVRFAGWCRAIVSAALLELGEQRDVTSNHQALTYLLAGELRFAKTAAVWTAYHGMSPIRQALRELPGYALVLLAASPNDTAARFMARDAFWAAVMSRA
ncbi:MAG: hypothetical protein ACREH3_14655, partial [Geminicoccales bacterium]